MCSPLGGSHSISFSWVIIYCILLLFIYSMLVCLFRWVVASMMPWLLPNQLLVWLVQMSHFANAKILLSFQTKALLRVLNSSDLFTGKERKKEKYMSTAGGGGDWWRWGMQLSPQRGGWLMWPGPQITWKSIAAEGLLLAPRHVCVGGGNRRGAKYPPNELCPALLSGLTVQPCGELRCCAAGFFNFCPFWLCVFNKLF